MNAPTATPGSRVRRPALRGLAAALALAALLLPEAARAHSVGQSYLYLQIYEDRLTGRFEIALSDFNHARGLEGTSEALTPENLQERAEVLRSYYREKVELSADGQPLEIRFTGLDLLRAHGRSGYALQPFELPGLEEVPPSLTVDYGVLLDEEPGHRGFLLVEHHWAAGTFANESRISLVFTPDSRRQDFPLESPGRWHGFLAVVGLGIDHIWEGVDHILFLLALLLPAVLRREDGKWRPVESLRPALLEAVKIVTAFTVAHSVTLSLAALGWVQLPGRLVEVIIAISVAIAAADLLVPIFRGRIWLVVAGFGLFHGFGFAGALSKMGVLQEHMGLSLFGFNLGVEIGQVAIVAVVVPVLFLLRRWKLYTRFLLPAAAAGMILISTAWVVERSLDVDLPIRELLDPRWLAKRLF